MAQTLDYIVFNYDKNINDTTHYLSSNNVKPLLGT